MEAIYNKELIKKLYPTKEKLETLIKAMKEDVYNYTQYTSKDSKERVKRGEEFLNFLENLKGEY